MLPSSMINRQVIANELDAGLHEGSQEISGKLDKVVGQLNIITKTLHILEQRMRVTEEQVGQLMDKANSGSNPFKGSIRQAEIREDVPSTHQPDLGIPPSEKIDRPLTGEHYPY